MILYKKLNGLSVVCSMNRFRLGTSLKSATETQALTQLQSSLRKNIKELYTPAVLAVSSTTSTNGLKNTPSMNEAKHQEYDGSFRCGGERIMWSRVNHNHDSNTESALLSHQEQYTSNAPYGAQPPPQAVDLSSFKYEARPSQCEDQTSRRQAASLARLQSNPKDIQHTIQRLLARAEITANHNEKEQLVQLQKQLLEQQPQA